MHDANSIAILVAAMAAFTLLAYLWRSIDRRVQAGRLRRSLRLAVGGALGHGGGHGFMHGRDARPLPDPGDEDMAA